VITLTASMPDIQIEYYDPGIIIHGSERNYQHTWRGDYPTDTLIVQMQQPLDARQVQTSPATTSTTKGSDGLTYHTIEFGPQPADQTTTIAISYVKETDTLTVEGFEVQSSAPISERTSGRVNIMDILPWGLGILGIFLLVGGLWWYWQTGREKPVTSKRSRGKRRRSRRTGSQVKGPSKSVQGSPVPPDNAVYCHQCGKRAEAGDRFCRSCGTKFRVN
jgi:hypothetical protein